MMRLIDNHHGVRRAGRHRLEGDASILDRKGDWRAVEATSNAVTVDGVQALQQALLLTRQGLPCAQPPRNKESKSRIARGEKYLCLVVAVQQL